MRDEDLRKVGMRRRGFIRIAGAGALALAVGRRAWAVVGRTARSAFPKPPWRRVDREKLREPHDLAG